MRIQRSYAVGVSVIVLLAPCLSLAQGSKLSASKQSRIEAAVAKFMETTHAPGVSVGVVENGKYEWARGFGLADAENNVPAGEHTLYRLGSISKPLTAVGALQLWERGKLDLDAPVQKYCPAFPDKQKPIRRANSWGTSAAYATIKRERTILRAAVPSISTIPSKPDSTSSRTTLLLPTPERTFTTPRRATPWWAARWREPPAPSTSTG